MLDFVFSNEYRETMEPVDPHFVEVRARDAHAKELFRFTSASPDPGARDRMARIVGAVREHGFKVQADADQSGLLVLTSAKDPDGDRAVAAEDLGDWPELRSDLLSLDRQGRLAIDSIRRWLRVLAERREAGRFDEAFQIGVAAFERGRISYIRIRIRIKDDSSLKRSAAESTFEAGRKAEAVEIIEGLAKDRLTLIEKEWKT
jgi:hypothetical protein